MSSLRDGPHLLARELPEGPIRKSQQAIGGLSEDRRWWVQRLGRVARMPDSLYRGLAFASAAALGWGALRWAEQLLGWDPPLRLGWLPEIGSVGGLVLLAAIAGRFVYYLALEQSRNVATKSAPPWPTADRVLMFGVAAYLATYAFASITALLVSRAGLPAEGVGSSDPDLLHQAFGAHLWQLADVVPLIKVTETLNWDPSLRLETFWGGAVLLLYKLALIVPAAHLLALALSGFWSGATPRVREGTDEQSHRGGSDAGSPATPTSRSTAPPD